MTSYLVQLPDRTGYTLEGGKNAVVVEANDATDAKEMAKFASGVDAADWDNATATAIAAPADMLGWQLRAVIFNPTTGATVNDFTYTGVASDVLDNMGTGLAALFNVPYTAAYNATTQVITLATGTGIDNLGDQAVAVGMFPPGADTTLKTEINGVTGAIVSVTDQGVATADLKVTLAADAWVVPSVPVLLKA